MLRLYVEKAQRFDLKEELDRIFGVIDSVVYFGAKPCSAQQELESIYQDIDDFIEQAQIPPTAEEVERLHPNMTEDEE